MTSSQLGLRLVTHLDEKTWRQFVDRQPHGNIFHTPEMFHVFEQAKNHVPQIWAVVDAEDRIYALWLPVQLTLYNGLLQRLTTRAVAYGGVLCDAEALQALELVLSEYTRAVARQILFSEIRNLSDEQALQPTITTNRFIYEEHLNYLIDLDGSADQIMQRIGARTRKHIRQCLRKQDVVVREVTDRNQISVCYSLIQKSYVAAGVPLADISLFNAAFDVLYPLGMIKFWLASVQDADVAASVELLYKDVIYGWYSGLNRAYADYLPGELLMWHILRWGAENGYRVYDFGGAGKPGERYGVRDFKAKFGGKQVSFGRNVWIPNRALLMLSKFGYRIYRYLK